MRIDRRKFCESGVKLVGAAAGAAALPILASCTSTSASTSDPVGQLRWGMVIDLRRCRSDCTACLEACRAENNVAFHGDQRWDIHWIRKVTVRHKDEKVGKSVPLLCNHCDEPPCAQVCPVQATYKREDGIVVVDQHRCIGCRYCMVACPYNARYFNFKENPEWPNKDYPKRSHGVVESCNFCAHRLERGQQPACVEACSAAGCGALAIGNLNDPGSVVSRNINASPARRIREDLGTKPKVYYIGL